MFKGQWSEVNVSPKDKRLKQKLGLEAVILYSPTQNSDKAL